MTWPGASSRIGRTSWPSKCMSAYTRSSSTKKLRSTASSARRARRSSERLRPVGFWQALWSPTSFTSWRASRRSSPSTSMPCSSTGTPITRAPDARIAVIIPMKVGDSTTATSPGSRIARAASAIACWAPEVITISSGSSAQP